MMVCCRGSFAYGLRTLGRRRVPSDEHPATEILAACPVFALTAACFFALGIVVYRDDPEGDPSAFTELSSAARAGFMHWRAQNCLVCHQLYGFGGYLDPDLTHVAQRVDESNFLEILKKGTGPMSRVKMGEAEAKELYAS